MRAIMYNSHEYAGLDDMSAMLGLVSESWRHDGAHNRFHIGDVYWNLGTQREESPDQPYSSIRLWSAQNGEILGFAWFEGLDAGDVLVHPNHRHLGMEEEMLDWLEELHRASARQSEGEITLQIGGYEDSRWQQLLMRHGYVRDDRIEGEHHFSRMLDNIEHQTPLTGIELRSVAGEHEATKRTMVQRAAFATLDFEMPGLPVQAERPAVSMLNAAEIDRRTRMYKNVMKLPGYRQDLDIVAVTEDGEFAACCTCWMDSENNVAEFEPVGCLPEFRHRGIMRALTIEGLHRLKALGVTSVVVKTNPFNLPAIRLYESCGFELVFHVPVYRKTFVG